MGILFLFTRMRLIYLLALFVCAYCHGDQNPCLNNPHVKSLGPLVRTASGSLVGKYVKVSGSDVVAFLGIPYAYPPVNEKRFLEPCAFDHWDGILNATLKQPPCMQYSSRNFSWIPTSTPSEDCLYLNIWTPSKCCCSPSDKLPVMVWIYGGGFYSGSADMDIYDGSVLAAQSGAVIVSINYRVGIFGFLNSGTKEAPGNVGLLDQNLALKWIKKNVEYFGGDPNSITIMGESAGAWSVSLHMVSPMSRNLFQRAVLESGTAYHPQLVDHPVTAYYKANTFAKVIGCLADNSSIESDPAVMECIKGKSSWDLAGAEDGFTSKMPQFFLPTYGNQFLPNPPMSEIQAGNIADVDVLIGNNRNEATLFLSYILPDVFKQDAEPLLNLEAAREIIAGLFQLVPRPTAGEIYQQYFQNVSGTNISEIVERISDAFGDYVFNCPVYFFAEKIKNTYAYWFTHRSTKDQTAQWLGVPHMYEVPYVFGLPTEDSPSYTSEDGRFSKDMIKKWSNFAQKGHPLGDEDTQNWPQFTKENPIVYQLNPKQEGMETHPRATACKFWRPYIES